MEQRRAELYEQLANIGDFRRGSVSATYRRCGKPNWPGSASGPSGSSVEPKQTGPSWLAPLTPKPPPPRRSTRSCHFDDADMTIVTLAVSCPCSAWAAVLLNVGRTPVSPEKLDGRLHPWVQDPKVERTAAPCRRPERYGISSVCTS
ncbi:MAG: DUF6788 family protein [Acidimicrobiales bacterium]